MYFEIQKEWEIKNPLVAPFDGPQIRQFPLVKVSLNYNLFLIDVEVEIEQGYTLTDRFIACSVVETLMFISQKVFKNSCISLLSRRCDNNGYHSASDLTKIIEAKDVTGQLSYIYYCKNGKKYLDSYSVNSEDELFDFKTIYYKS